jgi:hypothetical protein
VAKPPDRVQLFKQESAAGGGDAADDDEMLQAPLDPAEDAPDVNGLYFQESDGGGGHTADKVVTAYREGNALFFEDAANAGAGRASLSDLIAGTGGLTEAGHKTLRQLIHFIEEGPAEGFASGAFKEVIGGAFPTSVVWYEDNTKAKKLVEKTITRSGGAATNVTPTPIEGKVYDTDGTTVLATVTDAVSYSGVFETSRTRTIA